MALSRAVSRAARAPRRIYVAAPDGEAGGGMGRVKDYILRCPRDEEGRYVLAPLITRDMRGAAYSLFLLFGAMGAIAAGALRGRVALLHVNMGDRGSVVRKGLLLLVGRLFGVKTMLHLHAVELDRLFAKAGPVGRWLIRRPFVHATTVVVLGERFRDWVVEQVGVDPRKVEILYNGVDTGGQPDPSAASGAGPRTILFLGNMIERKGLSDLIAALAEIPAAAPAWRAVVAGGGEAAPYRTQAEALGIGDRIAFAGWVDQAGVREHLAEATMLVLPSYDEGLPLVILEALAMAVPVICTPVGVIGEVLDDGSTALFVPVGDRAALAARMTTLLSDPELHDRLSEAGHDLFRRRFSLKAFQTALLDIYRRRAGIDHRPERTDARS